MKRRNVLAVLGVTGAGGYLAWREFDVLAQAQESMGDSQQQTADTNGTASNNDATAGAESGGEAVENESAGGSTPTSGDTDTENPTPVMDGEIHELGDAIAVGNWEYTVHGIYRRDAIAGDLKPAQTDGVYLIVEVTVRNTGSETPGFPDTGVRLRAPDTWQFLDTEATRALENDSNIQFDPLGERGIEAGDSERGAVVFEAHEGVEYTLWFTPESKDSPSHFLSVGKPSEVRRLA